MFGLNFQDSYQVVHVNNELGEYIVGGAGTYMNEIYLHRRKGVGFIHVNMSNEWEDYDSRKYPGNDDILLLHKNESYKLAEMNFDILVIQFYEFAYLLTEEILSTKRIVYVIHSIPIPEPPSQGNPFENNYEVQEKFEKVCACAELIICVSYAEKRRLVQMYPQYAGKTRVVYNGITLPETTETNDNYMRERNRFGYIGRMDYRKGILECVRAVKHTGVSLHLACPNNDLKYLNRVLEYIEAADLKEQVTFHGWCTGERKRNFYRSLDALIIPSLYEPFGYVALEAMQYGVPVISSNNGGLNEILSGYKYKYNPYEPMALEHMIRVFQQDSNEEVREQQEILQENLKRFTVENMVGEYNRIWDELLQKQNNFKGGE